MMLAARADVEIRLVFLAEQHVVAARALGPEIVRGLTLAAEREGVADAVEPAHGFCPIAPASSLRGAKSHASDDEPADEFRASCIASASDAVRRRTWSGASA